MEESIPVPTAAGSFMSTRFDPKKVLGFLAENLDINRTLAAFPGITREDLKEVLSTASRHFEKTGGKGILRVDGASRGNPGQAGAGLVLEKDGEILLRMGEFLGEATNNEAEYRALILGIQQGRHLGFSELKIFSDSELLVRQMKGEYRVKNLRLQELYFQAVRDLGGFRKVFFFHVPREENREADRMANLAIDARGPVRQ